MWFEFEWAISGQIVKIDLALKSRFTRENLRFSKTFQTGLGVLTSRGEEVIKVDENGKCHNSWDKFFSCGFIYKGNFISSLKGYMYVTKWSGSF